MKAVSLTILALSILFPLAAAAGSLGKYDEPSRSAPVQQQLSPDEVKARLNEKMAQAIKVLNSMKGEEKQRWIAHYERKLKEASNRKDYLEAAYYRGILDGVK